MHGQNFRIVLVVVNRECGRDNPAVYGDPEILYIFIEPEYMKSKNWRPQIKLGLTKKSCQITTLAHVMNSGTRLTKPLISINVLKPLSANILEKASRQSHKIAFLSD